MVEALIGRLDGWLAANRPDYYTCLLPGATDAELDAFEARFSLKLPPAFRQFYRWRNGQDGSCSASLWKNFMFAPLEAAAGSKQVCDDLIGSDFEDPRWWRRGWVPFLDNGGGDHLCMDLAAEDGGTPGKLLVFYHDWEHRPVKFHSLEAWLADLVESMEGGRYEVV
jgi:cell wall assembly regulator SMI1